MKKKRNTFFNLFDISLEKMEKIKEATKVQPMEYVSFDTQFNEKGCFEYALFRTKQNGRLRTRMMRMLQVKSVSNEIRTQINNEEAFKNILNQFAKENISFTSLYAYKPGENLIIGYGILMEGWETELEKMEQESSLYIRALEDKFRSAYSNIEIEPITVEEEWLFEGFYYDNLTVVRGVPKPDPSIGGRVGTSYGTSPMMGRQVSEILLKGMTANRQSGIAQGHPFLMYNVFDRLNYNEIERALHHIQNTLGKLVSSREIGVSENENFSFPLIFGFGFGEMMGQSHGNSITEATSQGVSDSDGSSKAVSQSEGTSHGTSETQTVGKSHSSGTSEGTTKGGGGALGVNVGISDTFNWSEGESKGESTTTGDSSSEATGNSRSLTNSTSQTDGTSSTHSVSQSRSHSAAETIGNSQSENKSSNLSGGVNSGDGSGISRHQVDHFFDFAIDVFLKNEKRFQRSLRDGMFDYRTFILTKDEVAKVAVEELIKQSYMDNESPFPIRIMELDKQEESILKKYAKAMEKPTTPEAKPVIPERYKYSTYITPTEATAFNLPQENLPGYLSSFDPIPLTISYVGKMADGAEIGNQINRYLNMESPTPFTITKDKLGHIGIFGATNQGKTVFVQKFVSSIHNKYDINFLLFDWTRNHRSLIGHLKDKKKFRYNSFGKGYFPLKINLVEPPPGVSPYTWNPVVAELMCYSMGLGDRSFRIITKVLKKTQDKARDRNYTPTMEHFVMELGAEYNRRVRQHAGDESAMDNSISSSIRSNTKFMPSNEQQSFGSMIERMEEWLDKDHPVYQSMCEGPFMTIEQLISGDFVHLIECALLPAEVRQFTINAITAAIFQYCKCRDMKLKKPSYLIFEEAHTVLQTPTGNEPLNINETIFETINREARNFNLLIGYVCQSPETLPHLIFDNLPLRVIFQLPDDEGKKKIVSAGGKDPMRLDVDLVKLISRLPQGMCIIRNSRFTRIQDAEFIAVKVHMLPTDELSDSMFKTLYQKIKNGKSVLS